MERRLDTITVAVCGGCLQVLGLSTHPIAPVYLVVIVPVPLVHHLVGLEFKHLDESQEIAK